MRLSFFPVCFARVSQRLVLSLVQSDRVIVSKQSDGERTASFTLLLCIFPQSCVSHRAALCPVQSDWDIVTNIPRNIRDVVGGWGGSQVYLPDRAGLRDTADAGEETGKSRLSPPFP